jgi:Tol biopolymer transport system component
MPDRFPANRSALWWLPLVLLSLPALLAAQADGGEPFTLVDVRTADLAWSPDGMALAYSARSDRDWYYDLWTVDLLNMHYQCLTCGLALLSKNNGSPAWRPDGSFLVFTAENLDVLPMADALAVPQMGVNCNLWAMTADGRGPWPLTRYATDYAAPRAVVHPHFSRDGTRLTWAEAVGDPGDPGDPGYAWGVWQLAVADFAVVDGVPVLKNLQHHMPGDRVAFYRCEGFAPGDRYLLLAGNPEPGQPLSGMDIYEYDLLTGRLARLTRTPDAWDDFPCYGPEGRYILWSGGEGPRAAFPELAHPGWQKHARSEVWAMERGGADRRAVTRFNQAGTPDRDWFARRIAPSERFFVGDIGIDPQGERAALSVFYEGPGGSVSSVLLLMDLDRLKERAPRPAGR